MVKSRRRTLKNRGYASNFRLKKGTESRNKKAQLETYVVDTSLLAERLKQLETQIIAINSSCCSKCQKLIRLTDDSDGMVLIRDEE